MYSLVWFCQMKHQEWTLNLMPDTVCVAATWMICSLSNLAASLHANFLFLLCYLFMPLITILHTVSRLSSYFKYFHLDFRDFCTATLSQSAFKHPHYYASKLLCDGGDFKLAFQIPPAGGQIALGICVDLPQNLGNQSSYLGEAATRLVDQTKCSQLLRTGWLLKLQIVHDKVLLSVWKYHASPG